MGLRRRLGGRRVPNRGVSTGGEHLPRRRRSLRGKCSNIECGKLKKKGGGFYYTLTFQVQFKYDDDEVFMAHCYPYTYTDLQLYIRDLELDPVKRKRFRRRTLCKTLAGNNCDCLKGGTCNMNTTAAATSVATSILLTNIANNDPQT